MTEPVVRPEETLEEKQEEKGASLVEYALLVALIAVVCIVALRAFGNAISNQFNNLSTTLG